MIRSPHRLLTFRRSVTTILASATFAGTALAAVTGVAACGSSSTTGSDTTGTKADASGVVVVVTSDAGTIKPTSDGGTMAPDATFVVPDDPNLFDAGPYVDGYAASHPPFPTVVNSGGLVLTTPKFVLLSFDGYDYESQIEQLMSSLGASQYWKAVTAEYGISPAAFTGRVSLGAKTDVKGAYNDTDLQNLLVASFGKVEGLGAAPDPDTLYIFLLPETTNVTSQGATSCSDFSAYHSQTTATDAGAPAIPYVVSVECATFNDVTGVDVVTGSLSEEIIDAVADPLIMSDPGYIQPSDANLGWAAANGSGELSDMCTTDPQGFFRSTELDLDGGGATGFLLARSWSNALVATGTDPCVPDIPDVAFFDSLPVLTDVLPVTFNGGTKVFNLDGVDATKGSATIELDLFSDRPTGDWAVEGLDLDGTSSDPLLQFSFTGGTGSSVAGAAYATGNNGTKLKMTITPTAAATASPSIYRFAIGSVKGTQASGVAHLAYGLVAAGSQ